MKVKLEGEGRSFFKFWRWWSIKPWEGGGRSFSNSLDVASPGSRAKYLLCAGNRGLEVLNKADNGTWWTWDGGPALIFWRWGEPEGVQASLFGFTPWIHDSLPSYRRKALKPKADVFSLYVDKFNDIIQKGYVTVPHANQVDFVRSLCDYFHVPKAEDIRMVYNGTSCGLNKAV